MKAYEELNKRIDEHDEYEATKGDITLPVSVFYVHHSSPHVELINLLIHPR